MRKQAQREKNIVTYSEPHSKLVTGPRTEHRPPTPWYSHPSPTQILLALLQSCGAEGHLEASALAAWSRGSRCSLIVLLPFKMLTHILVCFQKLLQIRCPGRTPSVRRKDLEIFEGKESCLIDCEIPAGSPVPGTQILEHHPCDHLLN